MMNDWFQILEAKLSVVWLISIIIRVFFAILHPSLLATTVASTHSWAMPVIIHWCSILILYHAEQ
ncbi:Metallo-beta-lactamase family protein [Yersinia bercovieri ATCC 43970]|uniref:Metallo-beta-lactamase family protein n=1 Tax=Yersinia bercovieri ATCC 43970 TaxID=349968 RepID=A0ABP2E1P7_YERBE|nr:Metallo-beta-lactamase family protein [Yersinia bercovieri ATCC 43970]